MRRASTGAAAVAGDAGPMRAAGAASGGAVSGAARGPLPPPRLLVAAGELPAWATRYAFVEHGYRDPARHASPSECLRSVFLRVSNETLNVHTHLWPGLTALGCLAWAAQLPAFAEASAAGRLAVALSCAATFVMGLASAAAHTFHVMSDAARATAWRLDYVGILCPLFAQQWCTSWFVALALAGGGGVGGGPGVVFLALQAAAVVVALYCALEIVVRERYGAINISFVWSNVPHVVVLQLLAARAGAPPPLVRAAALALLTSALIALSGLLYNAHVPERLFASAAARRVFSFVGNSHQLMHVFTAAACYANTFAALEIAGYEATLRGAAAA